MAQLDEHSHINSILRERQAQYIIGREGNYEDFIFLLYQHLYHSSPFNYKLGRTLLNNLDEMKRRIGTLEDHIENKLGRTLLDDMGKIKKRIRTIEECIEQLQKSIEEIISMQNSFFSTIIDIKRGTTASPVILVTLFT